VDLSEACATAARRNGYDMTCTARLSALPFAQTAFDYVVSLDVLGHVAFEEKDSVLSEIRRVLRPDGVTMHGIECVDRVLQKDYDEMSSEELRRFVEIDGHVGLEEEDEHEARFKRFFEHTQSEPRYALSMSSEEFIKQYDRYGLPFEADFVDYLRGLSFKERRSFDMAMGYVFSKISDLHIKLPRSGLYLFLKASGLPLGPFYNQHRDRRGLFQTRTSNAAGRLCLDRDPSAVFDDGWYEPYNLPPIARWMGARSRLNFNAQSLSMISLDLTTHMPGVKACPLVLEFFLNGVLIGTRALTNTGWNELKLLVPDNVGGRSNKLDDACEFEIRASQTWRPRPFDSENKDDRDLSVAVCNIEIVP
jgi:hypothetical protein